MRAYIAALCLVLVLVACGPSGICGVTAGDIAGTYQLTVRDAKERELTDLLLTFSETGVDAVEVGKNNIMHCETGTTTFCALDIRCSDRNGQPKVRFLWSGEAE